MLNPIFCWCHVPSLLFDLRPNYGGANEDNSNLLQNVSCMHCYTQCLQSWSRPPLTHAFTRDSWILMGKSGSVSCGVTTSFSLGPGAQKAVCALEESVSPVLCKFWWLCGEVNGDFLQEASLIAQLVNYLPVMQEARVQLLGWEDPLEKETAPHCSILAWRIIWTEEPGRLQSMESQ